MVVMIQKWVFQHAFPYPIISYPNFVIMCGAEDFFLPLLSNLFYSLVFTNSSSIYGIFLNQEILNIQCTALGP